jgi:uncharacterized protein (DUF2062 family)
MNHTDFFYIRSLALVCLPNFHAKAIQLSLPTDNINSMVKKYLESIRRKLATWMRQGISPQRLALGLAIGCIPVVGIPTFMCGALALAFRLNLPAIQAANYAVMPLQLAMIVPFVRLGGRIFVFRPQVPFSARLLLHSSPLTAISWMGGLAGQALLGWLIIAIPAVALMTTMLTVLLRRIPAVAKAEAGS